MGTAVARSLSGPAPVIGLNSIASFNVIAPADRAEAIKADIQSTYSGTSFVDATANRAIAAIAAVPASGAAGFAIEGGAEYPRTTFGARMQDLAKLIKSGIGVEAATVDIGGWDMHNNLVNEIAPLLDELAKTLAAFHTDLGARMKNVTVVTMTEFGRRVAENSSAGTDHGRGSCMFIMGGGVIGRQVYTDWPTLADSRLDSGDLAVTTDYRSVLSEMLAKRGGNSKLADVFPQFTAAPTNGLFATR
jgi:uncharacterized protein (DUF1501 family)